MKSREPKSTRFDWSTAPTVYVMRPACPYCGSESYRKLRTNAVADGDREKQCQCLACNERYQIRLDSPALGQDVRWPRSN